MHGKCRSAPPFPSLVPYSNGNRQSGVSPSFSPHTVQYHAKVQNSMPRPVIIRDSRLLYFCMPGQQTGNVPPSLPDLIFLRAPVPFPLFLHSVPSSHLSLFRIIYYYDNATASLNDILFLP